MAGKRGDIIKMKKKYIKPQIAVENYYLSEMISGCGTQVTMTTISNCANNYDPNGVLADFEFMGVFTADKNCNEIAVDGQQFDNQTCYHTSTGVSVFGS